MGIEPRMSVDASQLDTAGLHLVNHSKKCNCKCYEFCYNTLPILVFVTTKEIEPNEFLRVNYGSMFFEKHEQACQIAMFAPPKATDANFCQQIFKMYHTKAEIATVPKRLKQRKGKGKNK